MRVLAAIILAVAATALPAGAATASVDSTARSVATFISANLKLGLQQTLAELAAQGLSVDSAEVIGLVREDLATPYDREAHVVAYEAVMRAMAEGRRVVNDRFMAEAKARPGAVVQPSGLVFETMTPGNGPHPTPESTVLMRYRGVLPDGTVFDEITPEQEPMSTRASHLVPGMTEGICLMQAGGNYILTIPAALAYGEQGAGGVIPPDTPLRFDVELVDIID